MEGTEYITLKEAAEISGYSPDYIGQLIRRGKITGKQVYANVAWVTTKSAVSDYSTNKKKKDPNEKEEAPLPDAVVSGTSVTPSVDASKEIFDPHPWEKTFRAITTVTMVISAFFLVFLFYVFSTLLDRTIETHAIERMTNSGEFTRV